MNKHIKCILNVQEASLLLGERDANLKELEHIFNCSLVYRNDEFICDLADSSELEEVIKQLTSEVKKGKNIDKILINKIYNALKEDEDVNFHSQILTYTNSSKPLYAKTARQFKLAQTIENNSLVFSIGPAGTGKTFISVLMACKALKKGEVEKIILTRPAVEAGESLGFLPGDLKEKADPYLMPLYDALDILLGHDNVEKYYEKGIIEVIPLAYMRGRTIENAFAILDEAQNTTEKQMLMFLTRLGNKAKMVINGDKTQIDLKTMQEKSGLLTAEKRLKDIQGIEFVYFNNKDVVRNPLIEKIIKAYSE